MADRAVLTIATSKKVYVDMAVNLARSFRLWNDGNGIKFYFATDMAEYIPADVKSFVKVITLQPGELGVGFLPKINLDKLAPAGQTLFIDSDCLIYGNLQPVFDQFKGHDVSVIGGYITDGDWFGDIAAICTQFKVERLPKFNGGIYYLQQGEKAKAVYQTARELQMRYDEIGFTRFRGHTADEMIMSLAMALHGQEPLRDDGTIMSDPQACPGSYKTDVIAGKTQLINPPAPNPKHRDWYPFSNVSPLVVHFLGHHSHDYQYRKDAYRLAKWAEGKLGPVAEAKARLAIEWNSRAQLYFKDKFRKVYHTLFGVRKVTPSERL